MKVTTADPTRLAKRFFFLAYQASRPINRGFLQAREGATEEDVWKNVFTRGDYPAGASRVKEGRPYADYVFGRMMKVGCTIGADSVEVGDSPARHDYQSWAGTYPDTQTLLQAAALSLSKETTPCT